MKRRHWQLVAGLALVAVSLILYAIHYVVFGDSRHIFLWSFTGLAFLPISVLFVTLIINRLLTDRDRRAKLQKMNMVIGAFFSEVGNDLLALLSRWDDDVEPIRPVLAIRSDWQDRDFKLAARRLAGHKYSIVEGRVNLQEAQELLTSKRASLSSGSWRIRTSSNTRRSRLFFEPSSTSPKNSTTVTGSRGYPNRIGSTLPEISGGRTRFSFGGGWSI